MGASVALLGITADANPDGCATANIASSTVDLDACPWIAPGAAEAGIDLITCAVGNGDQIIDSCEAYVAPHRPSTATFTVSSSLPRFARKFAKSRRYGYILTDDCSPPM